jgi:hypothetical protein
MQPLAIDLHYLLCAYSADDLHADVLLGIGMHLLHEMPVVTRAAIRSVFAPVGGGPLPATLQLLSQAGIADQIETIKITPTAMTTDEMSKLWSAFQSKHRPSAAYTASVLLIESQDPPRSSLPVLEPRLYAMPLRRPTIEGVDPQILTPSPGAVLTLRGYDLLAPDTRVIFGSGAIGEPDRGQSSNERLVVPLTAAALANLRAGVMTVQVNQRLLLSEPPTPHRGFESNIVALMVRPTITTHDTPAGPALDIDVDTQAAPGDGLLTGTIEVGIAPAVGREQKVTLLLNPLNVLPPGVPRPFAFDAPSRDNPDEPVTRPTITFPVRDVPAGTYLIRVRVDGADSELLVDANRRFDRPTVDVP